MTRVMGLLLFGVVAACGHKAEEPVVDPKAAVGFARALEAAASADPTQSAAMLAEGAYETIAPSMKCFQSFAAAADVRKRVDALLDCGLACTPDAVQKLKGKEPRIWMAALAGDCEPEHFGLEKTDAAMLSPEWFLVHKIGEEAARRSGALKGPDRAKLEQAMGSFHLSLPMPAQATGLYELPSAAEAASVPVATRSYVIVAASGKIRVGATPAASLGMRGAVIEAAGGQVGFPGNETAKEDLKAIVLEAGGAPKAAAAEPPDAAPPPPDAAPPVRPRGRFQMKANVDPQLARKQAIDNARSAGILGALSATTDSRFGVLDGTFGLPAGLHGEVDQDLRGDLGKDGDPVPLLLADGSRPAAEVIDLAGGLPAVLIGVAAPEETGARALAVDIQSVMNAVGRDPDQAWVAIAAGKLEEAKKAASGSEETVVIEAADGPWKDAVEVAAIAIARGARRVIFTTTTLTAPGYSGGGTGSAGALIGHGAYGQGKPAISLFQEGETTATGDLDKNVIRRVMHAHVGAMRACYEKELVAKPKLEGKVELTFTIARNGSVTEAKGTGLAEVTDCVVRVVKTIKFPAPAGGGVVNVRYPVIFKPKGE
jgi:hypothetical protein